MGCKYCKINQENILATEEGQVVADFKDTLKLNTCNNLISMEGFESSVRVEVNYCPMCGRKLVPDVKED